jgi:predicted phage terminase large subunit-like protein
VRAELCRRSLATFIRTLWHVLEPDTPLVWGPHLDAVCGKLEAVSRGEIRRLVINIPPGTMKSLTVSVFWPAWEWLSSPGTRGLYTAADDDLVKRDSRRTRDLIESDEYQAILAALAENDGTEPWRLAEDQNQKHWFENSRKGFRQCFSLGTRATGKRGRRLVIDDPHDVKDLLGSVEQVGRRMVTVQRIYSEKLESRLNDKRADAVVLIMQRVHLEDLAGWALAHGWDSLILPMEFEPERADPLDWRTEPGELLDPVRFPREVVEETKRGMSATAYAALYQQHPVPTEGGLFRRQDWVVVPRARLPVKFDRMFITADLAFRGANTSDFCVFAVIGQVGALFYVLDVLRGRWHYREQKARLLESGERWPEAGAKLVEDKANAHALLDDLHEHVPGLRLVPARDGKEERAQAWSYVQQARQIHLPEEAPWRDVLETEHEAFPHALNDDQVDALGHGILWALANPVKPTRLALDAGALASQSYWR